MNGAKMVSPKRDLQKKDWRVLYKVAILTISDKCSEGLREDETGKVVSDIIKGLPADIVSQDLVSDEPEQIKEKLVLYCDELKVDLVLTNGGTGLGERDNTPEVTKETIEKEIPGIPEVMRAEGLKKTPRAILSRGVAGLRKKTLIINLPGSPKGAKESLEAIMPALAHGLDMIEGKEH